MSQEYIVRLGTKEILLSRALKYLDNPVKCQSKLDLTKKEYKLLANYIKKMAGVSKPKFKEQPQQQFKPQVRVQPQPQVQVQVQVQPQTQHQPQTPYKTQWYDMIASRPGYDADEQQHNSALLERVFLNPEQKAWTPAVGVIPATTANNSHGRTSSALAGRIFDIVNPEMPNIGSEPRGGRCPPP